MELNTILKGIYRLQEVVYNSSNYEIHQAFDMTTNSLCAIKSINPRNRLDDELKRSLKQEALCGIDLIHPNIIKTMNYFEEDGNLHVVYEWLEGDTLRQKLDTTHQAIPYQICIDWVKQILNALVYANLKGVFHLNLNPDNIIVMPNGMVKVIGFGKPRISWFKVDLDNPGWHPILYIAPEIYRGDPAGTYSDVYSIGVILYQLLTRRLPWNFNQNLNPLEQKQATLSRPVLNPELLGFNLPGWIFPIINRSMILEEHLRIKDCEEFLHILENQKVVPYIPVVQKKEVANPVLTTEPTNIPEKKLTLTPPKNESPTSEKSTEPEKHDEKKPNVADPKKVLKLKTAFYVFILITVCIICLTGYKYYLHSQSMKFNIISENDSSYDDTQEKDDKPKKENKVVEMIAVPAGTAVIGNIEPNAESDEFPVHNVKLPSFMISKSEITQEQWLMVYNSNPSAFIDDRRPVENVTYYDAIDFCNEKSLLDGLAPCYEYVDKKLVCNFDANGYRLPTEAEWEYAAKAGMAENTMLYSGNNDPDLCGWSNQNSDATTHPVAQKQANQLGIYDLSGNVWEWCWNWYSPYSQQVTMIDPTRGTDKVLRGGSWYHSYNEMRITNRFYSKPYTKASYIGFRVVRSL